MSDHLSCPFCGSEIEVRFGGEWLTHPYNNCVLEGMWFKADGWNQRVMNAPKDGDGITSWTNYLVRWGIDIYAGSVTDAARKAQAIQRNLDPDIIATVFDVRYPDGNWRRVDLTNGTVTPI